MKKAIGYVRFSSSIQIQGDSLRRQKKLIDEWLKCNPEYSLDSTTYEDLGLSAYKGQNAHLGAFAEFMDAVEHGMILPGTVLLVESLDRLSREKIGEATDRLKNILRSGVDVVTLCDQTHYTKSSLDDPYSLIKAILIAQRANEESEIKSRRIQYSWQKKREDAALSGKIMTRCCPRWLKVNADRSAFEVIEEYAETIKRIYSLRLEGKSFSWITKTFNDENIKNLKGEYKRWNPSTVEKLLKNKALIGVFVPSYRTVFKGAKEVSGYYPRVISDEFFYSVQEVRLDPFGVAASSGSPYLVNILKSLMRCSVCNKSMIVNSVTKNSQGYYVCPMRRLHRCDTMPIKREQVDISLVNVILFNSELLRLNSYKIDLIDELEKRNVELHFQVNNILNALKIAPAVDELADELKKVSQEIKANEESIGVLKQKRKIESADELKKLDLGDITDRKRCQRYALKIFKEIRVNTSTKTGDIIFENGFKFIGFPLDKPITAEQILSSLIYADEGTLIF